MIYMKKILIKTIFFSIFSSAASAGFGDFVLDPFSKCRIKSRSLTSKDFKVSFSEYTNKQGSNGKALLVLPPTGGKNIIDKGYASLFCKGGYTVYIMEHWTGDDEYSEDLKIHERYQNRFQKAVSLMLQAIGERKIGVLGASAGAINFSVTMNIPKEINKVTAFMGIVSGGPLCKVIAHTEEKALKLVREKRMENLNINNIEDYENKICSNLDWQIAEEKPKHLKVGLIIATEDKTILTKHQEFQAAALNPELLIKVEADHRDAIIRSFLFERNRIKAFIDQALN